MASRWNLARFAGLARWIGATLSLAVAATAPSWSQASGPTVAVASLRVRGADLDLEIAARTGAPRRLLAVAETLGGRPIGTAVVDLREPGRRTVPLLGAARRFGPDALAFRLRLRSLAGEDVAPPVPFVVDLRCEGNACRFATELGIDAGDAVWRDERLGRALADAAATGVAGDDLIGAAIEFDPGVLGSARALAARLTSGADGQCRCRWFYSTEGDVCSPVVDLAILGTGVLREDALAAQRRRRGSAALETDCWSVRPAGHDVLTILGQDGRTVSWPRVAAAPCGSCGGSVTHRARFRSHLATAIDVRGSAAAAAEAEWTLALAADGAGIASAADALALGGSDDDAMSRDTPTDWTGSARRLDWQAELSTRVEAADGADRLLAESSVSFEMSAAGTAACATPASVSASRVGYEPPSAGANPEDPDQISILMGECRPPR